MDECKSDLAFRKHRTVETPRPPLVPSEKNNVLTTSRLRTRDVPSRYKSPSPSTPSGPRRCPSPNLTRTGHTSSQLIQKRSISVDRRRPSTPPSPPSPSKSVHACSGFTRTGHTSSQLVQKRSISVDRRRPSTPPSPPSPSKSVHACSGFTRTGHTSSQLVQKRSISVDRRRPSTPPSPPSPSTPIQDSSVDMHLASRKVAAGRMPESLWPSTMRSLSVSFQSDTISIPVSKKEKPAINALSERTLRPSSNVAHKQVETPSAVRKPTPERKRSPLKGKNVADQSENSRPVDGLHTRLIDQHRWPSRIGGKVSSNALSRSADLADKTARTLDTPVPGSGSLRRTPSSEGIGKPLQKSSSDTARLFFLEDSAREGFGANLADDNTLQACGAHKLVSTILSDSLVSATPVVRSRSLPSGGSRPPSPNRTSMMSSSVTRGISPSRTRPSTPPSRGISPSRIRASATSNKPTNPNSVLSFIADFRKGKKGSNYIEDAHQLRLLYNRYMQWRFANARSQRVLYFQKVTAERTLFNVWSATLSLWDSVTRKRINLQQLKLELKLNSVLNDQMRYLDDWALLERDHITSLSGAVEDLEASTLRLPVTGRARADIDSLKVAICSAVDVMQAMASSICSLLPRAESINRLVSELATIAAREKSMLDECEALLASTAAMQVEEYSLRTHLIQRKEDLGSLR